MICLGRRDKLDPPLELEELYELNDTDALDEQGMPTAMPDLPDGLVAVIAVTFEDSVEKLTVCETLKEIRNEVAWCSSTCAVPRAIGYTWYVAHTKDCFDAYMQRQSGVTYPMGEECSK